MKMQRHDDEINRCIRKGVGPLSVQLYFLKTDNKGDMAGGAGKLFKYSTTRIDSEPVLRRMNVIP